ncbi:unnamed protein product [Discula destructiva]
MAESTFRPILLPQNRKIRHLQGIFLRNLTYQRPRGKTADDSAVKHSPEKAETLRESIQQQLHHCASSENLASTSTSTLNLRPGGARRRSTNLGNATPLTRQKHLEASIEKRVADVFFSLHVEGEDDPVYISEIGERSANFDFRLFELSRSLDPVILRLQKFTVKVWVQRCGLWSLHLQELVDLRHLKFLGSLIGAHFPPNCLVFHLVDGAYTFEVPAKSYSPRQGNAQPTSSYNALMRLSNLEHSIQDALATQDTLKEQINSLIATYSDGRLQLNKVEDRLLLTSKYVALKQKAVDSARTHVDQMNISITQRRQMIIDGRELMTKTDSEIDNAWHKLDADMDQCRKLKEDIRGQRRRICEDLNTIFKIDPLPDGKPLQFQIRGIHLPNAEDYGGAMLTNAKQDSISAALGHVALLTSHVSLYLSVPLPYEITNCGSRGYITDAISMLKDPIRDFPLYIPRGGSAAQFRFDYGWFVLNKDIEALCAAQGLKVMDIRHTLPNLKYLLYVCSAGTDDLPERKRGGVRGLRAGIMRSRGINLVDDCNTGSLHSSRRGSVDSDIRGDEVLRRKMTNLATEAGAQGRGDGDTKISEVAPVFGRLFDDEFGKVTLRTKGMRERVDR